jgi:hypothetical protein
MQPLDRDSAQVWSRPELTRPELGQPLEVSGREGEAPRCASDGRVTWSLG